MSAMNSDIASVRSRGPFQWSKSARIPAAISTVTGSRDLTAVVFFSVFGLLASLFFALFVY